MLSGRVKLLLIATCNICRPSTYSHLITSTILENIYFPSSPNEDQEKESLSLQRRGGKASPCGLTSHGLALHTSHAVSPKEIPWLCTGSESPLVRGRTRPPRVQRRPSHAVLHVQNSAKSGWEAAHTHYKEAVVVWVSGEGEENARMRCGGADKGQRSQGAASLRERGGELGGGGGGSKALTRVSLRLAMRKEFPPHSLGSNSLKIHVLSVHIPVIQWHQHIYSQFRIKQGGKKRNSESMFPLKKNVHKPRRHTLRRTQRGHWDVQDDKADAVLCQVASQQGWLPCRWVLVLHA